MQATRAPTRSHRTSRVIAALPIIATTFFIHAMVWHYFRQLKMSRPDAYVWHYFRQLKMSRPDAYEQRTSRPLTSPASSGRRSTSRKTAPSALRRTAARRRVFMSSAGLKRSPRYPSSSSQRATPRRSH